MRLLTKKQIKVSLLRRRKPLGPAASGCRGEGAVLGPSFFRVTDHVPRDVRFGSYVSQLLDLRIGGRQEVVTATLSLDFAIRIQNPSSPEFVGKSLPPM